jgi:hypothetical protein
MIKKSKGSRAVEAVRGRHQYSPLRPHKRRNGGKVDKTETFLSSLINCHVVLVNLPYSPNEPSCLSCNLSTPFPVVTRHYSSEVSYAQ